jgi:hypothetical protein
MKKEVKKKDEQKTVKAPSFFGEKAPGISKKSTHDLKGKAPDFSAEKHQNLRRKAPGISGKVSTGFFQRKCGVCGGCGDGGGLRMRKIGVSRGVRRGGEGNVVLMRCGELLPNVIGNNRNMKEKQKEFLNN